MSSKPSSQGLLDLSAFMPRAKTEDEIAIEKILAQDQRENPAPESPGAALVDADMRNRMRRQRNQNRAEIGLDPKPQISPQAVQRMNAYTSRKARR